jgi:hypothetical protein
MASPATAVTGPMTAQIELPLMKLPPMSPTPCSVHTIPATSNTTPTTARRALSITLQA